MYTRRFEIEFVSWLFGACFKWEKDSTFRGGQLWVMLPLCVFTIGIGPRR